MKFWSNQARDFLRQAGREDLIDKGDDLGERVAALLLTALGRLNQYATSGGLYDGSGGTSLIHGPQALLRIEAFVDTRLRAEIDALENLLLVFDDLSRRRKASTPSCNDILDSCADAADSLEEWYFENHSDVAVTLAASFSAGTDPDGLGRIHVWSKDPQLAAQVFPKEWDGYSIQCLKTPNVVLRSHGA